MEAHDFSKISSIACQWLTFDLNMLVSVPQTQGIPWLKCEAVYAVMLGLYNMLGEHKYSKLQMYSFAMMLDQQWVVACVDVDQQLLQ